MTVRVAMDFPRILRLRALCMDEVHLTTDEVLPLLRHRFVLMFYPVILSGVMAVDVGRDIANVPMELLVPIYALALCAGLVAAFAVGAAMLRWAGGRGGVRVLYVPVLTLVVALVGHLAAEAVVHEMERIPPVDGAVQLALQTVYYFAVVEALLTLALHGVVPRALADLRGRPMQGPEDTWLWPETREDDLRLDGARG